MGNKMILVTGASGLLGSHLICELLKNNKLVRALIRSESSKKAIEEVISFYADNQIEMLKRIEWVKGDISNKMELSEMFRDVNVVYHCAAFVSFNERDKSKLYKINIGGTANIVNQCIESGIEKLVHVSSIAAIKSSKADNLTVEENGWPENNSSAYSYSKTQSELEVWRGISKGLNAVIVNPSVIIGPGNWNRGSSLLFKRIKKGMKYYTEGGTGFVDVRDVASIMIQLMESSVKTERYILNGLNISYKDFFECAAKALSAKVPQKCASPFLTGVAWRLEWLKSKLFFCTPQLTRTAAKLSHKKQFYSSEKIAAEIGFQYKKLEDSIQNISRFI